MPLELDSSLDSLTDSDTSTLVRHEIERAERRRSHKSETEETVRAREEAINLLRDQRHKARIELCARLGDFGYAYDAGDHSITRISLVAPPDPAILAASPAVVPEPFDPAKYGIAEKSPEAFNPTLLKWIDRIAWCSVPFLGAFVGYSIGMLAGFPVKAEFLKFGLPSVVFGVALLATMKGSLYAIVHAAGRRAAAADRRGYVWTALAIALFLVLAEVGLGATAIRRYSEDQSIDPTDILPWFQTILVALCFSTPMLVASIVKGWSDGAEHDSSADRARVEAERHHKETAAALREHEASLRQRDEEARAKAAKALADFEEANAKHREDDRWKTAMSLYGAIGVFDREIDERENLLKGFKISRGFSLAGESK